MFKTDFNNEKERLQKDIFDYTNQKLHDFQQKLIEYSQDLEDKKTYCENLVKENETNTLWKIRDCEGMIFFLNILLFRTTAKTCE